jgi:hypothetical protein
MAKVFYIHSLELNLGVTEEEFKSFLKEELPSMTARPGHKLYVIKGIRGDREGQYTLLGEIESLENYNQGRTPDGQATEEYKKFEEDHPENKIIKDKFWSMVSIIDGESTDYVELD